MTALFIMPRAISLFHLVHDIHTYTLIIIPHRRLNLHNPQLSSQLTQTYTLDYSCSIWNVNKQKRKVHNRLVGHKARYRRVVDTSHYSHGAKMVDLPIRQPTGVFRNVMNFCAAWQFIGRNCSKLLHWSVFENWIPLYLLVYDRFLYFLISN